MRPGHRQFVGFQRKPYVDSSLFLFPLQISQRQVVGLNPFRHQDIVEHPVVVQLVPPLGRLGRIEPPSEIVRLGDLAFRGLDAFLLGHAVADEIMQSAQTQPPFYRMDIVVVVRCVQQKISVVKYSDST